MTFESDYYESPAFWSAGMVEDAGNLRRLEVTCELVPEATRNLIDVGCGNGVFARLLKHRRPEVRVTCVDRSAMALESVQADDKRRCELTNLPFEDRTFDCVTCLQVLEHLTVPDFPKALAELARIARSAVIIGVPYNEVLGKTVDTCPQCRTIFDVNLHFRSFNDATFAGLLREFGFRMEEVSIPVINKHYLGFRTYYKLQRMLQGIPERSTSFMSPICPLCGYIPERQERANSAPATTRAVAASPAAKRGTGTIKALVKRLWPKQTVVGYWIVGRFTRS